MQVYALRLCCSCPEDFNETLFTINGYTGDFRLNAVDANDVTGSDLTATSYTRT